VGMDLWNNLGSEFLWNALASHCKMFDMAQMNSASQGIVATKTRSLSLSTSFPTCGSSSLLSKSGARSGMSSMSIPDDGIGPA
jgi:hypothetical protein